MSSTAVQQASDLTKENNLLSSVSYGVTNVSSKVADVGAKAWTNINTYWNTSLGGSGTSGGGGSGDLTSSLSNFNLFGGGRTGYNSMSGESLNSNNNNPNNYASYNNNNNNMEDEEKRDELRRNESSSSLRQQQQQQTAAKQTTKPAAAKQDDWNDWENNEWEDASVTAAASNQKKREKTTTSKVGKKTTTVEKGNDLIKFDEDGWETIEPSSKNK